MITKNLLASLQTNQGENLLAMAEETPVLLFFLRHFGCIFCRASLRKLAKQKQAIAAMGVRIVFVHMAENKIAESYFDKFKFPKASHISDPTLEVYKAFGLEKGTFNQLYGLAVWVKGFQLAPQNGFSFDSQLGDFNQMPGIFLLQQGAVKGSYTYSLSSEQVNFEALVTHWITQ